jgi:hypothetical protein
MVKLYVLIEERGRKLSSLWILEAQQTKRSSAVLGSGDVSDSPMQAATPKREDDAGRESNSSWIGATTYGKTYVRS